MTDRDDASGRRTGRDETRAGAHGRAPKLSVALITYNQEGYIGDCLQSIVDQVVDFDYEVVIGEDCSPDGTLEIVRRFESKYPGIVRVLHDRNHGVCGNFARTILACTGKYVALAEGDDLWVDARKLALQVDYLDRNPDCALCFHDVEVLTEKTGEKSEFYGMMAGAKPGERTTILDLLPGNYISTCSTVFRRSSVTGFPPGFDKMLIGDYGLFLMVAQHGWMGFIDKMMSMYRVHDRNAWANRDYLYRIEGTISAMENVIPLMQKRYAELVRQRVFWWNYEAARVLSTRGDETEARTYARRCAEYLRAHDLGVRPEVVAKLNTIMA